MNTLINMLYMLFTNEMVKKFIISGLRRLVKSTDSGIDNALLEIILNESVQSKLNDLTEDKVKEIKEKYNIK